MSKNCVNICCPFIPYCRKYSVYQNFEDGKCIHAEQIAIRAKEYIRQLTKSEKTSK